ncbi:putative pre-mRNA splicing factor prp1 [Testicularia cyperi]|uniref:Putative pre-mRNA splicing factor prp1 n=1 Tax=Testicularia cyperi TaxID=1882483 RepID=A0A317XU61_9BASI|nr:putative pre-mRNA splicing factor prp1 [Testicularia cyperi]
MADKPNKLAFLSMQAPAGYVAGLGRGASGFTTRADIGPARQPASASTSRQGKAGDAATNVTSRTDHKEDRDANDNDDDDDERFQDPDNEIALFAGGVYEKDDEEADRIWESVDAKLDARRRKFREAREREEQARLRAEQPKIQTQFADLKRGLAAVTEQEWAALSDPGNLLGKRRKAAAKREARDTRSFAVSDTVLIGNRDRNAVESALTTDQMQQDSPDGQDGSTLASLSDIGAARNKIFSHQLDQASVSSSNAAFSGHATSVDPKGYLTELSSSVIKTDAEIGDIKKARSLLDSVIKTNPKHAPGWIAAARVEEVAGKMSNARKIIQQGCEHCPRSEDVWLENARLHTNENAKAVLARAVQYVSQSVKIWIKAVELESDPESKKRVLRKSLEYIPNSVTLWKELVNLEESPQDARILLSGAVSAVPMSIDLWLALARLSPPEEAKRVLNEARKTIPTSHEIWIAAARLLEESEGDELKVEKTMAAAVKALRKAGVELSREQWLQEAERVDREGSPMTSSGIIRATLHLDVEEEDRRSVWVEDAQAALDKGCVETSRAILAYTLRVFPDRPGIWTQAAQLEKAHGTREALEALLERAVSNCPRAEALWLMYSTSKVDHNDIGGARQVLIRAFDANIGSEQISLAAAKLESENGHPGAAAKLLERARDEVGSPRVWLKSAVFERNQGRPESAAELVEQAIAKFPRFDKFYMMAGQLKRSLAAAVHSADAGAGAQSIREARDLYSRGLKQCPSSTALWISASRLEEEAGLLIRARALLEKARLSNPKSEDIWAESVEVESRGGSPVQAKSMLARGLQEIPSSGLLWSLAIRYEPRSGRKTKSADALKKTGDDARVISTIAQMFWLDSKHAQARKWFQRATTADADNADVWATWYRFEIQHGDASTQQLVKDDFVRARPRHGQTWQPIAKNPKNANLGPLDLLDLVAHEIVPLK